MSSIAIANVIPEGYEMCCVPSTDNTFLRKVMPGAVRCDSYLYPHNMPSTLQTFEVNRLHELPIISKLKQSDNIKKEMVFTVRVLFKKRTGHLNMNVVMYSDDNTSKWCYFETMEQCALHFGISNSSLTNFVKTHPQGLGNITLDKTTVIEVVKFERCSAKEYRSHIRGFTDALVNYASKSKDEALKMFHDYIFYYEGANLPEHNFK